MATLSCVAFFISLTVAYAARIKQRSNIAAASRPQSKGGAEPFKIHAVTFNAGNNKFYKGSDTDGFYDDVLAGHEESDMVILGFQEIWEDKKMQSWLQEQVLWKQGTAKLLADFRKQMTSLATPPAEILHAQEAMRYKYQAFHATLKETTQGYMAQYSHGSEGTNFREHILNVTGLTHLGEQSEKEVAKIKEQTEVALKDYAQRKDEGAAKKFPFLDSDMQKLADKANIQPDITGEKQIIKQWALETEGKIKGAREEFPNLYFTPTGEQRWKFFLDKVDNELLAKQYFDKALRTAKQFQNTINTYNLTIKHAVNSAEKSVLQRTVGDWIKVVDDLQHLQEDLRRFQKDEMLTSFGSALKNAKHGVDSDMHSTLRTWDRYSSTGVEKLLDKEAWTQELQLDNVIMARFSQHWDSRWRCHTGQHFDTNLHVFVNPSSRWKVQQIPWHSADCPSRDSTVGCDIDNNQGWECGKVVNLIVMQATRKEEVMRICALNTHMSFAAPASSRGIMISKAMEVATKQAMCESVVFVGDFNSRMHCVPNYDNIPLFDLQGRSNSMTSILSKFSECTDNGEINNCAVSMSDSQSDELNHLLRADAAKCYESAKNLKRYPTGWRLVEHENPVMQWNFREPLPPLFMPTYKVKLQENANQRSAWTSCFKHQLGSQTHAELPQWSRYIDRNAALCYENEDKKAKHNPAWTDRILIWSRPNLHMEASEYGIRRTKVKKWSSDHLPVVTRLAVGSKKQWDFGEAGWGDADPAEENDGNQTAL